MECFICGCGEENEEECKFFAIGRTKFIVCSSCLLFSDPKRDFEDVKDIIRVWQAIKKKFK